MATQVGYKTKLQLKIATVYTDVANVVSINGPSANVTTVDGSHLQSTKVRTKASITDLGEVSGTLQVDLTEASHTALVDLINTPDDDAEWKIVFPNGSDDIPFTGLLTAFGFTGMESGSMINADFTIKVNSWEL